MGTIKRAAGPAPPADSVGRVAVQVLPDVDGQEEWEEGGQVVAAWAVQADQAGAVVAGGLGELAE